MQISINWLNQLVNSEKININTLSDKLTLAGFEVEDILNLNIFDKDDTVFDIASTANRADTLNMLGFRTEISALLDGIQENINTTLNESIQLEKINYINSGTEFNTTNSFESCTNLIGTKISNIQVGDSPIWLKRRLLGSGMEPQNNILDIATYVMLEWGQPFHIYDSNKLEKLTNNANLNLSVRNARTDEQFVDINNLKYNLSQTNLVVCVDDTPISLAGIIGSKDTEVDNKTTSIFIEGAIFDSKKVRQSSRAIGLRNESSSRFEKTLNSELLPISYKRLIKLIKVICLDPSVKVSADKYTIYRFASLSTDLKQITLAHSCVNQILGPTKNGGSEFLTSSEIENCFRKLKFNFSQKQSVEGTWSVDIPSYRINDLFDPIDLIEEIGRIYGFNNFLSILPNPSKIGLISGKEIFKRKLRQSLINLGLKEVVQYSLTDLSDSKNQVEIINPLLKDYSSLRISLIPSLIKSYTTNIKATGTSLQGFEIGRVFKKTNNQLKEFEYISGIFSKELYRNNWQLNINDKEFNWFDAKGLLQEVFEKLDLAIEWQLPETEIENDLFQLNRTSELYLNGEKVGVFSQLHPRVALKNEILLDTFLFELDLNCLSSKQNKDVVFANYFDYPTIVKDIAFSVPVTTTFMSIKETIKKSSGDLLDSISLIDEYKGKQVDEGSKSLTIKLIFKSSQRTLTNTEIDQLVLNINQQLNEDLAAVLR